MTINHALTEMHPQAVKIIFARLYSAWGDTDKKMVIAESRGNDYFKRRESMLADIRLASFAVQQITDRVTIFQPNEASAAAQRIESSRTPSFTARTKRKVTKRVSNLIVRTLHTKVGQRLAKLIKRGPIHQREVFAAIDSQTQPLYDFFENFVADERTPDEIFLKPRAGDIK